jgi:hypothetical protein
VPGRSGMTWEEEDWVDDDATAHRGLDEWSLITWKLFGVNWMWTNWVKKLRDTFC